MLSLTATLWTPPAPAHADEHVELRASGSTAVLAGGRAEVELVASSVSDPDLYNVAFRAVLSEQHQVLLWNNVADLRRIRSRRAACRWSCCRSRCCSCSDVRSCSSRG